jgi:hypothetical protein
LDDDAAVALLDRALARLGGMPLANVVLVLEVPRRILAFDPPQLVGKTTVMF